MHNLRRPAFLAALLASGAVLLTLPLVTGFWGRLHPAFDSLAHVRVHLSVLVILMALPGLFLRGWRAIGAGTILLALAAIASAVVPLGGGEARAAEDGAPTGARYRLLQLNLRYDNATPGKVLSLIGEVQPDVITVEEVAERWKPWLALTSGEYPYRIVCPAPAPIGGVAILSRRPFAHSKPARCYDRGSLAVARVRFGGRSVDVAALHLGWPWPFDQPRQIQNIGGALAALQAPAILAGDFNATPWSAAVAHVAEAGRMRILRGIGSTWLLKPLPDLLRRHAGLPIDNLLVKGPLVAETTRKLPPVGSDHLPVLLEFDLRTDATPPAILQTEVARNYEERKGRPAHTLLSRSYPAPR